MGVNKMISTGGIILVILFYFIFLFLYRLSFVFLLVLLVKGIQKNGKESIEKWQKGIKEKAEQGKK